MAVTNRYYGGTSLGAGGTIPDFGLCDLKGVYLNTAKARPKGMLVVAFFTPSSPASAAVLQTLQSWFDEIGPDKWTALAPGGPDRDAVASFAEPLGLTGITVQIDHELYWTRAWGISRLPTTLLVDGKTGRILTKATGDDAGELASMKQLLTVSIAKIKAAEEAAKQAEEAKKAAEAAAKAATEAATAKSPVAAPTKG